MLALGSNVEAAREVLDDFNVGGKAGAGKNTLEEIVAEERVLRNTAGESRFSTFQFRSSHWQKPIARASDRTVPFSPDSMSPCARPSSAGTPKRS